MDFSQFRNIARRMERTYGTISKEDQEKYMQLLMSLEGNMFFAHQEVHASSVDAQYAVLMALYYIRDRMEGTETDLERFETHKNLALKHALLLSFDPFTSEEIAPVLEKAGYENWKDAEFLKTYYPPYIRALLKLYSSIELWNRELGSNGYFQFLTASMGKNFGGLKYPSSALLFETIQKAGYNET